MIAKENEILNKAINNFIEITGLKVSIVAQETGTFDNRIDAIINIEGQTCNIEVKLNINTALIALLVNQYKMINYPLIIITRYVTPNMAELLKRYDIQFIDTVGNAYINLFPQYVFIMGQKDKQLFLGHQKNRAFKPTGLKVIFALLNNPELENNTYRVIVEIAQVALGTVNWVMRDLKLNNFLIDRKKKRRFLVNKKELLDRWVTTYPENLRKGLLLGKYRAVDDDWWKIAEMYQLKALWSGEIAAAQITKYLRPQDKTIYIEKHKLNDFIKLNKLIVDPRGNIEILTKFWAYETDWRDNNRVPTILVYADLLNTGDPRNIEAAKILYEKELYQYNQ
jgi:hypothetical protein